jgi:tetratricopeptide (TPR) repeat protein
MTKDNILFAIIGVLLGFIVGFFFANTVNQKGYATGPQVTVAPGQASSLPADHPSLPSNAVKDAPGGPVPAVQAAIEEARDQPSNFDAQIKAARLFVQVERFDQAMPFLTQANKLRPDDYGTIVMLGNANFDSGKLEEAEKWYASALAKKPDDLAVRTDYGTTFVERANPDYDRAIKEFRRVLDADPKQVEAASNLVIAWTRKGDAKQAQAALDMLRQLDPQNPKISGLSSGVDALKSTTPGAK